MPDIALRRDVRRQWKFALFTRARSTTSVGFWRRFGRFHRIDSNKRVRPRACTWGTNMLTARNFAVWPDGGGNACVGANSVRPIASIWRQIEFVAIQLISSHTPSPRADRQTCTRDVARRTYALSRKLGVPAREIHIKKKKINYN